MPSGTKYQIWRGYSRVGSGRHKRVHTPTLDCAGLTVPAKPRSFNNAGFMTVRATMCGRCQGLESARDLFEEEGLTAEHAVRPWPPSPPVGVGGTRWRYP